MSLQQRNVMADWNPERIFSSISQRIFNSMKSGLASKASVLLFEKRSLQASTRQSEVFTFQVCL